MAELFNDQSLGMKTMDKRSNGFTLVELIVVIAILGIIAAIAVPRLSGYKGMAEEKVCSANRKTAERLYSAFLLENDHEDSIFTQFLMENFDRVCPAVGEISYEDGKVKCSVHKDISDGDEEPPEDEVPWL